MTRTLTEEAATCPDCRQPAIRIVWDGVPNPGVVCEPCSAVHAADRRVAERERVRVRQQEFSDLPFWAGRALVAAGYRSRAAVAQASDTELFAHRLIGPKVVAAVRERWPAPMALTPCPHCHGTGYVDA